MTSPAPELRRNPGIVARFWMAEEVEHPVGSLLLHLEGARRGRVRFDSPDGWSIEGVGEAIVLESDGAGRLGKLAVMAARAFASLQPLVADAVRSPLRLVGGFAFVDRPASERDRPWARFGSARFVLPELGLLRRADGTAQLFAVAPLHGDSEEARALCEARLAEGRRLLAQPAPLTPVGRLAREPLADADEVPFEHRVRSALDSIRDGHLFKVTIARRESWAGPAGEVQPVALLDGLARTGEKNYRFWIQPAHGPAFVGSSPERLIAREGTVVRTEALAGTVACSGDPARDEALGGWLQRSPKERREHDIVVHFLRERLANISLSLQAPADPELLRLRHVQHLHTPMIVRLDPDIAPSGVLRMAERLHPTPAVAGVPTELAVAHLTDHEPLDRGWYAGGVGAIDPDGDGELCVAIRSALLEADRLHLYAGAGIVQGSDPAAERVETEHKLKSMREALCG